LTTVGHGQGADRPILAVPRIARALRWYEKALGARVTGSGELVELEVEGTFFWVRELAGKSQDSARARVPVKVFVDDPAGLVERAAAAGADDLDEVREHQAPWGIHRKGGFTDRYGHRWIVGGRLPLRAIPTVPAHHMGYVRAVADRLNELDFRVGHITNVSTGKAGFGGKRGGPKRAASLFLPDWWLWPWWKAEIDVTATVDWDEEFGWTATKVDEINAGPERGRADMGYGLGLDVVAEPAEVALRLGQIFTAPEPSDLPFGHRAYRRRDAANLDWELEAALAAYLPT
jgi:uncharacterized glyoxalase superfamily protein PhnB